MQLTTVELSPKRILYTIPLTLFITEEELHVANATHLPRGELLDLITAFVDYQYGFCEALPAKEMINQLPVQAGRSARVRLYDVVIAAVARLAKLVPENASELTVVSYSRRVVHLLVTIT